MPHLALTKEELLRGCEAFEKRERRDAMYRVASRLIEHSWGESAEVADALGILLLTWNQAFYRYGLLDCDELEGFLRRNADSLGDLRARELASLGRADEPLIARLFNDVLQASRRRSLRTGKERCSPVSSAKALHLLAPDFFPLWDDKIARAYDCGWSSAPVAFPQYLRFMQIAKAQLEGLGSPGELLELTRYLSERARFSKPLLKFLDEYNYAHVTKGWV